VSGRRYTFNAWGRNRHVTNIKGAVCPTCEGRKKMIAQMPQGFESVTCPTCGGTGLVVKGKR
jgi:Zn ribbon nucleic-acid-binding protein